MDEPCYLNISIHPINRRERTRQKTYSFNTSTTCLTFSLPRTCTSTLTSSNTSSCPGVPISGVLSGPGINLPVPLVSQHCGSLSVSITLKQAMMFKGLDLPHPYIKSCLHPSRKKKCQRGLWRKLHLLLLAEKWEEQSNTTCILFDRPWLRGYKLQWYRS